MADYILERRVWLPRARSDVFEFFADPANLARVQPRWARPRWIGAPPRRLAVGAVLDFRVPGLPGAWRIIVREFDPLASWLVLFRGIVLLGLLAALTWPATEREPARSPSPVPSPGRT